MNNPMWFVETNLQKVKTGTRALERQLVRSAQCLSDSVGVDAAEILRHAFQRLLVAMVELGLLSLVRQLMPTPSPTARIYPLRVA